MQRTAAALAAALVLLCAVDCTRSSTNGAVDTGRPSVSASASASASASPTPATTGTFTPNTMEDNVVVLHQPDADFVLSGPGYLHPYEPDGTVAPSMLLPDDMPLEDCMDACANEAGCLSFDFTPARPALPADPNVAPASTPAPGVGGCILRGSSVATTPLVLHATTLHFERRTPAAGEEEEQPATTDRLALLYARQPRHWNGSAADGLLRRLSLCDGAFALYTNSSSGERFLVVLASSQQVSTFRLEHHPQQQDETANFVRLVSVDASETTTNSTTATTPTTPSPSPSEARPRGPWLPSLEGMLDYYMTTGRPLPHARRHNITLHYPILDAGLARRLKSRRFLWQSRRLSERLSAPNTRIWDLPTDWRTLAAAGSTQQLRLLEPSPTPSSSPAADTTTHASTTSALEGARSQPALAQWEDAPSWTVDSLGSGVLAKAAVSIRKCGAVTQSRRLPSFDALNSTLKHFAAYCSHLRNLSSPAASTQRAQASWLFAPVATSSADGDDSTDASNTSGGTTHALLAYARPAILQYPANRLVDGDSSAPLLRTLHLLPRRGGLRWTRDEVNASTWVGLASGELLWALYAPGRPAAPPGVGVLERSQPTRDEPRNWFLRTLPDLTDDQRPTWFVHQQAGQALVVPPGWWYTAVAFADSVLVLEQFASAAELPGCLRAMHTAADPYENNYMEVLEHLVQRYGLQEPGVAAAVGGLGFAPALPRQSLKVADDNHDESDFRAHVRRWFEFPFHNPRRTFPHDREGAKEFARNNLYSGCVVPENMTTIEEHTFADLGVNASAVANPDSPEMQKLRKWFAERFVRRRWPVVLRGGSPELIGLRPELLQPETLIETSALHLVRLESTVAAAHAAFGHDFRYIQVPIEAFVRYVLQGPLPGARPEWLLRPGERTRDYDDPVYQELVAEQAVDWQRRCPDCLALELLLAARRGLRPDWMHYLNMQDTADEGIQFEEKAEGRVHRQETWFGTVSAPWMVQQRQNELVMTNMWTGASPANGSISWLHNDASDNIYLLIRGRKRLRIYSPADALNVYIDRRMQLTRASGEPDHDTKVFWHPSQRVQPNFCALSPSAQTDADIDRDFPNFRKARQLTTELRPGDAVYLPAGWYHEIQSYGVHQAINFWVYEDDSDKTAAFASEEERFHCDR